MSKYNCEHGKNKYFCKECGGSQICIHNKNKSRCKECGGSQICIHNKYKSKCKECKECKGSGICIHNKQKYICVECNGNGICKHKLRKTLCDECGGSGLCIHKKQKKLCKDCGNTYEYLCQHNKNKYNCKDCGNTYEYLCQHNKHKYYCRECGGKGICTHNKNIQYCKECGGDKLCKSEWCEITGNYKYEGYCLVCYIHIFPNKPNTRNYKTKEKDVVDRITQTFTNFTWVIDKKVQDGCSRRRPDLLLDMGSHIIIVEVDENKHTDYDCSCEHKRLMELSQDLQHRPIVFIRFNPDDYTNQDGELVKSCWKLNALMQHGLAYHHGGLPADDRAYVESEYLAGRVQVLVATSTLAYGVNLPAHLVVIKDTNQWRGGSAGYERLPKSTVLQMVGRAGRVGFDTSGFAVVMTSSEDRAYYDMEVMGMDTVESTLQEMLTEGKN